MKRGHEEGGEGRGKGSACGRHSDLMVCALDSGSSGPCSSPGWVIVLCSWVR